MNTGKIVLALKDVAVGYSRRTFPIIGKKKTIWALQSVSFDVTAGETLGVIGRNGAGKTTLLKLLAGILDPDRGTIDRAPVRTSLLSLQVGFLPHLTGRENAILSSMLLGLSKQEAGAKLDQILEFAEINDFVDELVATYSAGMRARLGFSVAYHSAPDILLIDEVLGVGDVAFRAKSSAAIKDLITSDKTVILVSHQASTLKGLCDRAVWIENGTTQMQGPTLDVVSAYEEFMSKKSSSGSEALAVAPQNTGVQVSRASR